jgi:ribonuclease HI
MKDLDDIESHTVRFRGDELGVVSELAPNRSRLVLKPVHQRFPALVKLVRERGGTVIDVGEPAAQVEEKVIRLAKQKHKSETPEPSGGDPYEVTGHTYAVRETLKQVGLQWADDEGVWKTRDPDKWRKVIRTLGAEKTDDRTARVPQGATPKDGLEQSGSEASSTTDDGDDEGVDRAVLISTDGACKHETGAGGWAAVLHYPGSTKTIRGGRRDTTSNRMELLAIVKALRQLPDGAAPLVRSDSEYAIGVIDGDYTAKANRDLVEEARDEAERVEASFKHVRAHAGDPDNEAADQAAGEEAHALHDRISGNG